MSLDVSRAWLAALAVFAVVVVATTAVLLDRAGGPSVVPDGARSLVVDLGHLEGLEDRGDVLVRGVRVGSVGRIVRRGGRARVTLDLDGAQVDVRRGATVRVGLKTLLGEAYLDLDPGPPGAPVLPDGARLPASGVLPSVGLDDALRVLDRPAREDLTATVRGAGRAAASPLAAQQVSAAAGRLREAAAALRRLTSTLRGQEDDIAASVTAGRTVLDEAARREAAVRGLVTDASRTLGALTRRDGALRATAQEVPAVLRGTTAALRAADPLVRRARRPVADLRAAAPDLAAALARTPGVARDLDGVLTGAGALRRSAAPALRRLDALLGPATAVTRRLDPALGDLVTTARYVADRRRALAAWFSNTAALGRNGDAKGRWARFFIFADPASLLGQRSGLPGNAYVGPDDALANRPHVRGSYPRLRRARP